MQTNVNLSYHLEIFDLLGRTIDGKVNKTVAVSPLVIVPGDDLVEMVVQVDACQSINNGRPGIVDKVLRHEFLFDVSENALEGAFRCGLESRTELRLGGRLFGADRQVHHRNIGSGNANRHARQFAVELRNDLTHSLGGTRTGRDQVVQGRTAGTPVLASLAGTIDGQLVGSRSVDGGHETFNDAEFIVDHLRKRGEAVGSARRVGKNGFSGVGSVVDTHDEHWCIRRRRRDDDTLCTSLQVSLALANHGENTG